MSKYRFTLAEDDETELFLLYHTISQTFPGSSISSFTNAEDALRHIIDSGTDILITDHGMGRMSGTQLIKELRREALTIPIVMVSGSPHAEKEALEAGATAFLLKSADRTKIQQYLHGLLPGAKSAMRPAPANPRGDHLGGTGPGGSGPVRR